MHGASYYYPDGTMYGGYYMGAGDLDRDAYFPSVSITSYFSSNREVRLTVLKLVLPHWETICLL